MGGGRGGGEMNVGHPLDRKQTLFKGGLKGKLAHNPDYNFTELISFRSNILRTFGLK